MLTRSMHASSPRNRDRVDHHQHYKGASPGEPTVEELVKEREQLMAELKLIEEEKKLTLLVNQFLLDKLSEISESRLG